MAKKQIIRLTESDLHNIIRESIDAITAKEIANQYNKRDKELCEKVTYYLQKNGINATCSTQPMVYGGYQSSIDIPKNEVENIYSLRKQIANAFNIDELNIRIETRMYSFEISF